MAKSHKKDKEITLWHKIASRWKIKTNELKWTSNGIRKTNVFIQRLITKALRISIVEKERSGNIKAKVQITINLVINFKVVKQIAH